MATTVTTEVPSVKNDKIVGAFKTQEEANYVRSEIESAGINGRKLSVEGFIDPGTPRSFCVVVDGSASEIDRARRVVEKSSAADVYGRAR